MIKYIMPKKKLSKKTKRKKIKSGSKQNSIETIKGDLDFMDLDSKNTIFINNNKEYRVTLAGKFSGGKSGDLVYLIKNNNKKYVMKIFMEKKSANHEIKLHKKNCDIFSKVSIVPKLYSYGEITNIPFHNDKVGIFKYMIMEAIINPTELSDYVRSNCKENKNKNINPYNIGLQLLYYLAMIHKNKVKHCDIHTKNILIIKSNENMNLDFSFLGGNKINVGKYHIKIIDFGISEINKHCERNRRFIGAVLGDINHCKIFNKKDFIHIKKDALSMFKKTVKKSYKPGYYINEDLYIFVKILRLLGSIDDKKITKSMTDNIQLTVKKNKKDVHKKIFKLMT